MPHLQERLQGLWDVYQRLGLEDDIVDPSNTLLREGPVLKISFRRSDPMERYLVLVGAAGWLVAEGPALHPGLPPWGKQKSGSKLRLALKTLLLLKTAQQEGIRLAAPEVLLS